MNGQAGTNYRNSYDDDHDCGLCMMFMPPTAEPTTLAECAGRCELFDVPVDAAHICDRYVEMTPEAIIVGGGAF